MPLPPRVPVRTPAHTGRGTEWKPAEDCGTAPPGLVTPVWRNQTVSSYSQTHVNKSHVMCKLPTVQPGGCEYLWLHLSSGISPRLQKVRQLLGLGFSQRVSRICHKHHRNPVFPIAVHQVPETLFGCRDGGPSAYQHPVNVKQKPKQAALLFTHILKTKWIEVFIS